MARTVAIGHQDYETVRVNNYFYIDKTDFIREWWDSGDIVTLIARPRRFGKTLNMSMTEKFYHGFVLGLMVDLSDRYRLTSNSESGFGRYDVMLIPRREGMDGIIIEFKVFNPRREKDLEETAQNALDQIREKDYARELIENGVPEEQIRAYGFAFRGKEILIEEL